MKNVKNLTGGQRDQGHGEVLNAKQNIINKNLGVLRRCPESPETNVGSFWISRKPTQPGIVRGSESCNGSRIFIC